MPIYEYKCRVCQHRFSVLQRVGEGNEELVCEKCGAPKPAKQFSTFAASHHGEGKSSETGLSAPGGSSFT